MKVLFLCKSNVGRSQIAEAIFNGLAKNHIAISAGINPLKEWEGQKLSKTEFIVPCMNEIGYHLNKKISKKLNKEMVEQADKIIVMGVKKDWPDFLKENSKKIIFWEIKDPDGEKMEFYRETRKKIEKLVKELLNTIED